ncbi:MAG: rRNA pseudouridine synthase [Planctomycetes bacterium]|nr:rRNA pseudouridine synthase [Planctomycetota bacterium]
MTRTTSRPEGAAASGVGAGVRLHKLLARAGAGSLRECERLIREGRVRVGAQVVTAMGVLVGPDDEVRLDGQPVRREPLVHFVLHKPRGVVCTNLAQDPRPRAVDLVPTRLRVYTVGRLDSDTEGLLLVTNDGPLSQRLSHPRYKQEKTYLAKVSGAVSREALDGLRRGVRLAEGMTLPARVSLKHGGRQVSTLRITIREGMNRQVRRMIAHVGLKLRRLRRVSLGPLRLGSLPRGASRRLTRGELTALRKAAGISGR